MGAHGANSIPSKRETLIEMKRKRASDNRNTEDKKGFSYGFSYRTFGRSSGSSFFLPMPFGPILRKFADR
jgi:hypothetical protein